MFYNFAQHGPDHESLGTDRIGIPFMESVEWEQQQFGIKVLYQIINDGYVFFEIMKSETTGDEIKYTAPTFYGNITTLSFGFNIGF